jgi:phage FluMu protein Com
VAKSELFQSLVGLLPDLSKQNDCVETVKDAQGQGHLENDCPRQVSKKVQLLKNNERVAFRQVSANFEVKLLLDCKVEK